MGVMKDMDRSVATRKPQVEVNKPAAEGKKKTPESGGPAGPEPTRYGDWERGGRCIDF
jgi:hypothetical protein